MTEKFNLSKLADDIIKLYNIPDEAWKMIENSEKKFIDKIRKKFCLTEEKNCGCARCKTINELAGERFG